MIERCRPLLVGLALAVTVAACGDSVAATDPSITSSSTSSTTSIPTTTTTVPPTTTTLPPTTTTLPAATCSATGSPGPEPVASLPEALAEARLAVIEAARACDYAELARIATASARGFTYSFGGGDDPAGYWLGLEQGDSNVLADLVAILNMSYTQQEVEFEPGVLTTITSWPAAFGADATEADWAEVAAIYTPAEIEQMKQFGGYIGWRVGFLDDGTWLSFVSGD